MQIMLMFAVDTQLITSILIVVLSIALIVFLVYRIIRERRRVAELKSLDGAFKKETMDQFIDSQIAHGGSDERFSLAKINLENHEKLLEKYGAEQYEKIFIKIRSRLKGLITQGSKLGQYEHSFLIFIKEGYGEAELAKVGKYIIDECSKPIVLSGAVYVTPEINVGLCSYPQSGDTRETLISSLNLALVVAKKNGANTFTVYTPKLGGTETEEYKYFMEIKTGIEKKQFLLYYQPIVDLKTLEVFGVEALLRWRHPTQGIVSPKDFLELIETSGDIYLLGLWTFEQMLEQQKQWRISYPDRVFACTVNLSLKQLMHPSLSDDIRRIVKKMSRFNPAEVCFEITEDVLNFKDDTVSNNLKFLGEMGFQFAIDNYGDADISIKALKNAAVKVIKLSRSFFMQGLKNDITKNIIEMLVSFGNENGIKIIAEGIEDAEMLERAQSFGLTLAQGYYFNRPVPAAECMSNIILTPWKSN